MWELQECGFGRVDVTSWPIRGTHLLQDHGNQPRIALV